jgi:hypothetical protein
VWYRPRRDFNASFGMSKKYLKTIGYAAFVQGLLAFAAFLFGSFAHAEVVRVEITQRSDIQDGRSFGAAGAYEWIEGRVYFALDPANTRNHNIVDLQLAPRNASGRVEFSADIALLQPKAATRANGVALIDVVNHGERSVLRWLQYGDASAPATSASALGDALLLNQGVTLVWVGWQQDLPDSTIQRGLMRLRGPVLEGVTGWVTGELVVDARVTAVALPWRFPVADRWADDSVLAVSGSRGQTPRAIPGDYWAFARMQEGKLTGDNTHLHVDEGFVPGAWYTYAYRAVNPVVTGLGLAVLRDVASWLRHDASAVARAKWVYAFGADQGGRLLRQFLHDGFNEDAAGRLAFDAMLVHGAGASLTGFNERFAQPSGTLSRRVLNVAESSAIKAAPKVFQTTTAWDYWGGGASFAYTTQSDKDIKDAALPPTTRVYHFAGAPNLRSGQPVRGTLPANPLDVRPGLRGLYVTLDQWVRAGTAPVASRYPLISARELVAIEAWDRTALAAVALPREPWPVFSLTQAQGAPVLSNPRPALVPQLDTGGNELAGIRLPMINAPLATYLGWNLRPPAIGAPRETLAHVGGIYPLARTREERNPRDPRSVITELYASRADYLKQIAAEAASLVAQRLMLKEDVPRVVEAARVMWDLVIKEAMDARQPVEP